MTIHIETNYLLHKGGTKFYEMVRLTNDAGQSMLIKRWGKAELYATGDGQTKIERGTSTETRDSRAKTYNEKISSAKGYWGETATHALGSVSGMGIDALINEAGRHYGDIEVVNAIAEYFDDEGRVDADTVDVIVNEEPAPEPDINRGSEWASW